MRKETEKHIFSFYYPAFSSIRSREHAITDSALLHRLVTIMRFAEGDSFVVFDNNQHAEVTVASISKKEITIICGAKHTHTLLDPEIVLFLPILKKDALEQAVYNAVVAGVTHIQLVVTEKCHRKNITDNERERLEKIIIAACEQSKYYTVPRLKEPLILESAYKQYYGYTFYYADFEGTSLTPLKSKSVFMVGPEGDLTRNEKVSLRDLGTHFFRLTPTVLRSQEAVLVALAHARMVI